MLALPKVILLCMGIGSSFASSVFDDDWSIQQSIGFHNAKYYPLTNHRSDNQELRHSDPYCQVEVFTAIIGNNVNTVLNDNADGKGLLLFSDSPDVCYVRDISQAELQSARTCYYGRVRPLSGDEAIKQRYYDAGGEISARQLPGKLRDRCQGLRIISLVDVTIANGGRRSERLARSISSKSSDTKCAERFILKPRYTCTTTRRGWLFHKRTETTCQRFTETKKFRRCPKNK